MAEERPVLSRGHHKLTPKAVPKQARARRTYENLLNVAARLLEEVGVERISTNLIAERAGVTVPALYRYFPNKYAVLHALGERLMDAQNEALEAVARKVRFDAPDAIAVLIEELILETVRITEAQPGGLVTLRVLRAVPALQNVRLDSHRAMSDMLFAALADKVPARQRDLLWSKLRVSIELGYAAVEMALEDEKVAPETVARETGLAVAGLWSGVLTGLKR